MVNCNELYIYCNSSLCKCLIFQSEDLFASQETPDIEDMLSSNSLNKKALGPAVTSKRKRPADQLDTDTSNLNKSWRDAIGNPPNIGNSKVQL